MNHVPTCTCIDDYIGDPFTACKRKPLPIEPVIEEDPCQPSHVDSTQTHEEMLEEDVTVHAFLA